MEHSINPLEHNYDDYAAAGADGDKEDIKMVTIIKMMTKMTLPDGTRLEAAGGRPDYDDDTDDGEDNKDDDEDHNDDYIRWHQARS